MIACLRIPYFAAQLHRPQTMADTPLLVVRYSGRRSRIVGLCAEAEHRGVQTGMSVSRARALCVTSQVVLYTPSRTRRMFETLQTALLRYSQWSDIERDSLQTAILYLDLGKLRPSDGRAMAHQIIDHLRDLGFPAAIGLAANKFTARVAAEQVDICNVLLIGPGEEAGFLATLSVMWLPLDQEMRRRLALLGLNRMGQVAHLPRSALVAQFGKVGERIHRLASGEDLRRVGRYVAPQTESMVRDFDPSLESRLILDQVLSACATHIMRPVTEQRLTCGEVTLTLRLDNRIELEAQARPRFSISSAAVLKRVLQSLLQKLTPNVGVAGLEIRLSRFAPQRPRQMLLFDALETPDPHAVLTDLAERYEQISFYSITLSTQTSYLPEWRFILEPIDVA